MHDTKVPRTFLSLVVFCCFEQFGGAGKLFSNILLPGYKKESLPMLLGKVLGLYFEYSCSLLWDLCPRH
jgi:hypothetical protein